MSFRPTENPCPCESGRQFPLCCGSDIDSELNFVFDLTSDNNNQPLSEELSQAVTDFNKKPSLFPVKIDFINNDVELVKMSPYWYSESTFLDPGRIQGRCGLKADINWLIENVDKTQWQTMPFVFHSAFCGSTLMLNALELLFNTLPLREPDVLGNLLNYHLSADCNLEHEIQYQYIVMSLLSRRFEDRQVPVYKGNDIQNSYLATLLDWPAEFPVLIMYTNLNEFVAACIKTEDRKEWIAARYTYCRRYFEFRFNLAHSDEESGLSFSEKAAAYWSYNMLLFIEAANGSPLRVRTLNFADMLSDPLASINACGEWFRLDKLDGINQMNELNWLMGQHAKNTTQAYSPSQREDDIKLILDANTDALIAAEAVARSILGDNYPENGLPNKL